MGHTQSTVGLLLAVVGCGGAKDAETRAPDTETTDTETGCAVQVDLSGGIEPGCGAIDAPCGTITAGLMEAVFTRDTRIAANSENSTACADVRKGYSRRLAYLKKYERLSLGRCGTFTPRLRRTTSCWTPTRRKC